MSVHAFGETEATERFHNRFPPDVFAVLQGADCDISRFVPLLFVDANQELAASSQPSAFLPLVNFANAFALCVGPSVASDLGLKVLDELQVDCIERFELLDPLVFQIE